MNDKLVGNNDADDLLSLWDSMSAGTNSLMGVDDLSLSIDTQKEKSIIDKAQAISDFFKLVKNEISNSKSNISQPTLKLAQNTSTVNIQINSISQPVLTQTKTKTPPIVPKTKSVVPLLPPINLNPFSQTKSTASYQHIWRQCRVHK